MVRESGVLFLINGLMRRFDHRESMLPIIKPVLYDLIVKAGSGRYILSCVRTIWRNKKKAALRRPDLCTHLAAFVV